MDYKLKIGEKIFFFKMAAGGHFDFPIASKIERAHPHWLTFTTAKFQSDRTIFATVIARTEENGKWLPVAILFFRSPPKSKGVILIGRPLHQPNFKVIGPFLWQLSRERATTEE